MVVVAIMAVILISVLGYIMLKYFPKIKKTILQHPEERTLQKIPEITREEIYRPMSGEIVNPIPINNNGGDMIRTDECIQMVQEVSKTLITEHSKWLAVNLSQPKTTSSINDIKRQAGMRSHTNTVINDLNKMVGK